MPNMLRRIVVSHDLFESDLTKKVKVKDTSLPFESLA